MFMKKGIIFAVLSALVAECGFVVDLATSDDPNYVDFPLGQGKTITLDVESSVREKTYIIGLKTEFTNVSAENWLYYMDKANKCPFEISVKGYKLGNDRQEVLFFDDDLIGPEKVSGGESVDRKEDFAFLTIMSSFQLPPGKYKFVITDHSAPNPLYQEMRTSIDIYAYLRKI